MNSIKLLLVIALFTTSINAFQSHRWRPMKKRDFIDNLEKKLTGDLKAAFENLEQSALDNYRKAFAKLDPKDAEGIVEGYLKNNLAAESQVEKKGIPLMQEDRRDIRHQDAWSNWDKKGIPFEQEEKRDSPMPYAWDKKGIPFEQEEKRDSPIPYAWGNWDTRELKEPAQNLFNKMETDNWIEDTNDISEDKRSNTRGLSPIEQEFLEWKEEKREEGKKNQVVSVNSMIDPLNSGKETQTKVDPISYFDSNLSPTAFGEDSGNDGQINKDKKHTLVPNHILKQLIRDYKRLKKLEHAYKAGKLGIKQE